VARLFIRSNGKDKPRANSDRLTDSEIPDCMLGVLTNDPIVMQVVGAPEIAIRSSMHDFHVRNATLLWELSSTSQSPIKSLDRRRINQRFLT